MNNPVRYWRQQRGWSQDQLADAAGCSKGAISQYENGVIKPTLAMCLKLAKALHIDPNVLLNAFHGVSVSPN